MDKARKHGKVGAPPQSFLDCLRHFLTPTVWKQVAHTERVKRLLRAPRRRKAAERWGAHPLVMVLLLMTWSSGDSIAERFETARAFYVAAHGKRKRPGQTVEGFEKALGKLPLPVLRLVADAICVALPILAPQLWEFYGFVLLGCDGSRVETPRSAALEAKFGAANRKDSAPSLWLTMLVHLPLGVPWSWKWGRGDASERRHLCRMLAKLPARALIVCDNGYVGYDVLGRITGAKASYLIRMSSKETLYVTDVNKPLERFRQGLVWYWPRNAQREGLPALRARLLRISPRISRTKEAVWLLTNIVDPRLLRLKTAAKIYKWRWCNEGLFRAYKRTLGKMKLTSRSVRPLLREAEGSALALQLLLAQTAMAVFKDGRKNPPRISPRKAILEVRREIDETVAHRAKRRRTYFANLGRASCERRARSSAKEKRAWPRRKRHTPPKPPKIRPITVDQKALLNQQLPAS